MKSKRQKAKPSGENKKMHANPVEYENKKKEIHEGRVIEAKEESPSETLYFLKKPPRVSIMPLPLPP
jgi:hypothetical protein